MDLLAYSPVRRLSRVVLIHTILIPHRPYMSGTAYTTLRYISV